MRLAAALLMPLAGCYEPAAVDCTISCDGPGECADGQVCGSDHMCAAPDIAGHCAGRETDPPATPSLVLMQITLEGTGKVSIDGIGSCDSRTSSSCTFAVAPNEPRSLKAIEGGAREFVAWSLACAGATSSMCKVTPVASPTRVGATFE